MKVRNSMPSNNSKYTQEMREQTVRFILENGKSATSMTEKPVISKHMNHLTLEGKRSAYQSASYKSRTLQV